MAIYAPQTAANGATGNYHRILKAEIICSPNEPVPRYRLLVGFYASESAREANADPMYVNAVDIPFSDAVPDPRTGLYSLLMESPLFANTNAEPAQEDSPDDSTLVAIKARKNIEINRARLDANSTSFPFRGHDIAYDRTAQMDIAGVNGKVTLTDSFPDGWPGGWKTVDNSYVAIPDVATWIEFYDAMVNQGSANFAHAQALKGLLIAATTVEEVEAISWATVTGGA